MEDVDVPFDHPATTAETLAACRKRWEIVKALVLGASKDAVLPATHNNSVAQMFNLFEQRDAVFAALADMARVESTVIQRMADLDAEHAAYGGASQKWHMRAETHVRGQSEIIAALVEALQGDGLTDAEGRFHVGTCRTFGCSDECAKAEAALHLAGDLK